MLQQPMVGKVILLKLITREEIVGVCEEINDSMIVMKEVFSLVLSQGTIQMIPFQFGNPDGTVAILPQAFLTVPEIAPVKLEEAYKNATSPIERAPAGMNVSSLITPHKR